MFGEKVECVSALSVTVFDCATSPGGRGKKVNRDRTFSPFSMRVSIAVCVARNWPKANFQQCKPMNFVPDGIHRMFQLTQHSPREDSGLNNQA